MTNQTLIARKLPDCLRDDPDRLAPSVVTDVVVAAAWRFSAHITWKDDWWPRIFGLRSAASARVVISCGDGRHPCEIAVGWRTRSIIDNPSIDCVARRISFEDFQPRRVLTDPGFDFAADLIVGACWCQAQLLQNCYPQHAEEVPNGA